ncbi:MAG: TetR family transcriptional regulator [Actinobacteria bacterium]|nr:MAG: TetR family transcriptional regulator [Actinomycetota bacterium]
MATRSHAAATAPPALSRERIARAGLELSDREGVEGLSMRRLARELGVTPMALYVHFRNKDELIDMVVDLGAREPADERDPARRGAPPRGAPSAPGAPFDESRRHARPGARSADHAAGRVQHGGRSRRLAGAVQLHARVRQLQL